MKSILPDIPQTQGNEVRQEQVAKKQKEYHLIGSQRKVPGHTLFELNRETNEIRPADVAHTVYIDAGTGKPVYKNSTNIKQGCFYIQALNIKNAEKKLRKLGLL
jgi:hypothetical protein